MSNIDAIIQGVSILGPLNDQASKILSKEATAFLALLHRSFNARRKELLQRRDIRQAELDKGVLPDFLQETKHIRKAQHGEVLHQRQAWSTGGLRSPDPQTGRWLSMH